MAALNVVFAMMASAWRLVVFYYRSLNSLWRPITKKIEFCKCRKGADLWFWAPCNRTQNIYNKHTFQNFSKSLISQNFLKIVLKRSIWMFSKFFIIKQYFFLLNLNSLWKMCSFDIHHANIASKIFSKLLKMSLISI